MNTDLSQVVAVVQEFLVIGQLPKVDTALTWLLEGSCLVKGMMVIGDLVAELANRWNFDGAGPVGVHETQAEGQVLKVIFAHIGRLVQVSEVVSWCHTTLGGQLGDKEEVKAVVTVRVLDKLAVNEDSRLWVLSLIAGIFDKHTLVYSLVHHYQCYLWKIH